MVKPTEMNQIFIESSAFGLVLHDRVQIKGDYDWIKPWSLNYRPHLLDPNEELTGVFEGHEHNTVDALKHLTSWLADTDDLDIKAMYK